MNARVAKTDVRDSGPRAVVFIVSLADADLTSYLPLQGLAVEDYIGQDKIQPVVKACFPLPAEPSYSGELLKCLSRTRDRVIGRKATWGLRFVPKNFNKIRSEALNWVCFNHSEAGCLGEQHT